jgi:AcrR family transcriptional regulator
MRCVAEVGYSQATIREIAVAAEIRSSSLYHYFPTKADLITATFTELAETVLPRLTGVLQQDGDVLEKLMAILDECEQLHRDFPYAAAFDRAIRAESARHLHLDEGSDNTFNVMRTVLAEILEQGRREGDLNSDVDVQSATNAIFALVRGLNEYTPKAPPNEYHDTVGALKCLIRGSLFGRRFEN